MIVPETLVLANANIMCSVISSFFFPMMDLSKSTCNSPRVVL